MLADIILSANKLIFIMMIVFMLSNKHYSGCEKLSYILMDVVMLSNIMLSVSKLSFIMMFVLMLSNIMLGVKN